MRTKSRNVSEAAAWRGTIIVETRDAATGELIPEECSVNENIVTDVGLAELARIVNGEALLTGVAWTIAVGTSTTTPVAGDTGLGASVFSAVITSRSRSSTSISFKLFIDTTQANGNTLTEAGLFHDGVNVDHALLSASIAKTSSKNVTITVQLTLSR
jgi:hypothetical protein